ncbi:MAG: hypothetical protein ABGX31_03570, partial [bacterium]
MGISWTRYTRRRGGLMDIEQRFSRLDRSNGRMRTGLLSLTIATVLIVMICGSGCGPSVRDRLCEGQTS